MYLHLWIHTNHGKLLYYVIFGDMYIYNMLH